MGTCHNSAIFSSPHTVCLFSLQLEFDPYSVTLFSKVFQLNGKTPHVESKSHGVRRDCPNKNELAGGGHLPSDSPLPPWIAQPCPCPSDLRTCFPFLRALILTWPPETKARGRGRQFFLRFGVEVAGGPTLGLEFL